MKKSVGERSFQLCNNIFLILLGLLCLYPLWYVAMGSISDHQKVLLYSGPMLLPQGLSTEAYQMVSRNPNILSGYFNTFFILIIGVILDMIFTCLGAYVLAQKNVLWKRPLMLFIMFTMFFSGGLIPSYLNMKQLHLTGTRWGLIIPFCINTYNMIILRTAFEGLPDSLIEAAKIDGAGHMTILSRIVLPLSKATLAVLVLYYGVGIWNGWFWASVLIRERNKLPLQVILREVLLAPQGDTEPIAITVRYATIIVATAPILCIYPFIQKYFTKGVLIGAVKE
ncbi:MAG TPA: carbohydrate ABC transporter permease [Candidatus Eisenbergiella merdipullorum]|uniref:Carbohydrate ABC transporter permease n=1 Tax=Candidatus Eisenbergiella merdipullorum TaxID=2838553 RepID=A0A9D2I3V8_9FIRM|nr:carbohydrate ABC transporter permease [Candidatus Eisenbergiella merdipullorum]